MYTGYVDEWNPLVGSLAGVKAPAKLLVPGNHDFHIQNYRGIAKAELRRTANTTLVDGLHKLPNGQMMLGIPYVTGLPGWAFNVEEDWLYKWLKEQGEPDVVVSHSPPYRILDNYFGSLAMNKWFYELEKKPEVWICGHIHEAYGAERIERCTFYNVCMCNEKYEQANPPVVIEL